jgi:thioredoxin reductase (NADPH)
VAFDYDVVIVGSGPAGLTAGLHLSRAGRRALVLEKDLFGGNLQHADRIDDYPEFPDGISGADLAGKMIDEATSNGVALESGDVSGLELFSKSRFVACSDGRGFSCGVVVLAGGTHYTKLGLDNEDRFRGRGVVDCTPCDGGFFVDRDVVVYGSNDYALRDALYLADLGSRVTLLLPDGQADASAELQARARSTAGITIREGARLTAIEGTDRVEGVRCVAVDGGAEEHLDAYGVLVRVGMEPSTAELSDIVDLDEKGYIVTNAQLETSARYVLACGDIRSGAVRSVATSVADGAAAAARALELLAEIER